MEAPEVARIEAEREAEVEEIERDYFWGDCKDALAFREGAQICKGATPTTPSPTAKSLCDFVRMWGGIQGGGAPRADRLRTATGAEA
jgi:hypothetical protein